MCGIDMRRQQPPNTCREITFFSFNLYHCLSLIARFCYLECRKRVRLSLDIMKIRFASLLSSALHVALFITCIPLSNAQRTEVVSTESNSIDIGHPEIALPAPPETVRMVGLNPTSVTIEPQVIRVDRSGKKIERAAVPFGNPPPRRGKGNSSERLRALTFASDRAISLPQAASGRFEADRRSNSAIARGKVPGAPLKITKSTKESETPWVTSRPEPVEPNTEAILSLVVQGEFTFAVTEYDADLEEIGTHHQRTWFFDTPTKLLITWITSTATQYIALHLTDMNHDDDLPLIVHSWLFM